MLGTGNYQLRPGDFGSISFELIQRKITTSGTATGLTAAFSDLAKDKLLVLTNMSGILEPGTGQGNVAVAVNGYGGGGSFHDIFRLVFAETADLSDAFNWQGTVVFRGRGPGEKTIGADAVFDSGVNSNTVRLSITGYIIPRANVAEY